MEVDDEENWGTEDLLALHPMNPETISSMNLLNWKNRNEGLNLVKTIKKIIGMALVAVDREEFYYVRAEKNIIIREFGQVTTELGA